MGIWLRELLENCGANIIVQIVGTKTDLAEKREVVFERCIAYAAEHLDPKTATLGSPVSSVGGTTVPALASPNSSRSSDFWAQERSWDCVHEVSAKEGEGVDEVFRVLTRKLVEQHNRKMEHLKLLESMKSRRTPGAESVDGYFDLPKGGDGSFRVGYGDRRRSWLGIPITPGGLTSYSDDRDFDAEVSKGLSRRRCC